MTLAAKRLAATLAFLALGAALPAAAADLREARQASGFKSIVLEAPIELVLSQGTAEGLVLEGDAETLADIETVVEDGVLRIRSKPRFLAAWRGKVRAIATAKAVEALAVSGSGDIRAGALNGERLKVAIAGSGDVRLDSFAGSRLEVAISGSGDFAVAGRVDSIGARISGSGDIRAGKLEARQASVAIAGSGDVVLWAKESLAVSVAGSGDVRYYGDPTIDKSILGSGGLKRLGAAPS